MKKGYTMHPFFFFFFQFGLMQSTFAQKVPLVAVTYDFNPVSRLGDHLICYLHAKWISYKYNIPLLYKPFPHSDKFLLDDLECRYFFNEREQQISVVEVYGRFQKKNFLKALRKDIVFTVPYFPESYGEREAYRNNKGFHWPNFAVDWKDEKFRGLVTEMLKPKKPLKLLDFPNDKLSVAIHVRTGGGFDHEDLGEDILFTGKLPPKKFYLDALEALQKLLPDQELYFYIFTDDSHPEKLASWIEDHLKNLRTAPFTVGYRILENKHDLNILEDMFSMLQFDCLIRPESNFSIIPSLLKDYKILIHPLKWYKRKNDTPLVKLNIVSN
jgi:glycosyltransferase involved in cell wall biosynthesis